MFFINNAFLLKLFDCCKFFIRNSDFYSFFPIDLPRSTSESGIFSKFRRWMNSSNNQSADPAGPRPAESRSCATSPTSEIPPVIRGTQSCASTPSSEQPPILPPINKDNLNTQRGIRDQSDTDMLIGKQFDET